VNGKVGAVRTKPLRGFVQPPPFLQSAFGYSEKWLRILLRAAPRDLTAKERTMARSTRAQGATLRIEVRITEEEKSIIKDQANSASLTMSEYIRRTALNRRILSKMDQKAAGELARLGGLQKHLLMQIKGLPDEEGLRKGLNSTLLAVHNAMRTLKTGTVK
jgi:predicted DNA binding CopG/RHH family protein